MTLRTKLLFYLLSISTLIIIVGTIFYFQLKGLIEPLTPQSIPLSIERLEKNVTKNSLINDLLYQQLLVQSTFENYVFTKQSGSLQNYYANVYQLTQQINTTKNLDYVLWDNLTQQFKIIETKQQIILQLMKNNNSSDAKKLIISSQYLDPIRRFNDLLSAQLVHVSSNENALVTVKLADKNIVTVLHNSLRTTLIIFINAILVSLLLVFLSTRAIFQPINLLRNNIELMSLTDLNLPIINNLLHIKGEVGDLARSFSSLVEKLRATTVLKDELLTEIERRNRIEIKLQKMAYNLRESNRDLDQFAYAASHDLRSPLRAIESLAGWIKEDCYDLLPKKSREHFDLIIKRVHRLDTLISGMLEYARAGRLMANLETVDVNLLINEIIDVLSPPSEMVITIDNNLPIISTNKVALTQVFLNLISNAIKYNDKIVGHINIGSKTLESYYQFYVADDGSGIEPQFFVKIFEAFQTLQSRDTIESSGIGLAIVNKIIQKVGGKVWVESALGVGTVFYFTWPKKLSED